MEKNKNLKVAIFLDGGSTLQRNIDVLYRNCGKENVIIDNKIEPIVVILYEG